MQNLSYTNPSPETQSLVTRAGKRTNQASQLSRTPSNRTVWETWDKSTGHPLRFTGSCVPEQRIAPETCGWCGKWEQCVWRKRTPPPPQAGSRPESWERLDTLWLYAIRTVTLLRSVTRPAPSPTFVCTHLPFALTYRHSAVGGAEGFPASGFFHTIISTPFRFSYRNDTTHFWDSFEMKPSMATPPPTWRAVVNCRLQGAWERVDQMSPSPDAAHRLRGFLGHIASITRMGFLVFNIFCKFPKFLWKFKAFC